MFRGFCIAPTNVSFTCSSKGTSRTLDFLLVSQELRGLVHCSAVIDVPWAPHYGLNIFITHSVCGNYAQQVRTPKELPSLRNLRKTPEFLEKHHPWDYTIGKCQGLCTSRLASAIEHWSCKTEINILTRAGIEVPDWAPYQGRGVNPSLRISPLLPPPPAKMGRLSARPASFVLLLMPG